MSVINEYSFFLDSKYRSRAENASPVWELESPLVLENANNYFECQIMSCEIPFSFKTLASPNNVLPVRFQVIQDSIDVTGNITIEEGNYSITSLLEELKNKLFTFLATSGFPQIPDLDFIYTKQTGRATLNIIRTGGTHDVFLTLKWAESDILAEYFGFTFENNTVLSYNTSSVVTSTNFISPNNVNVSPITSLYIRSSSLNQVSTNQERLVEQTFSVADILLKVPVTSYYNTWLLYENDSYSVRLNNKHIEEISLFMTSQTYDKVLLNGVHWRVALKITEYEPDFVKYMKYQQVQQLTQVQELTSQKEELMRELEKIKEEMKTKIKS